MKNISGFELLQFAKTAMPRFDEVMYVKKPYDKRRKRFVEWEKAGIGYARDLVCD